MNNSLSFAHSLKNNIWILYIIFLSIFVLFRGYSLFVIAPFIFCSVTIPLFSSSMLTCFSIIAMNIFMSIEFTTIQADNRSEIINRLKWYIFFLIILFVQFSRLCYLAKKQMIPELQPGKHVIVRIYQYIIQIFLLIMTKIYKFSPIISYVMLTGILIFGFANFYNNQNRCFAYLISSDGYYMKNYESPEESEDIIRIPSYKNYHDFHNLVNNLYFSTTTFYTVGYGDIEIRGTIPKLTVQLEILMSNILVAVFLPLSFRYLTDKDN